jgi:hypothetical protein
MGGWSRTENSQCKFEHFSQTIFVEKKKVFLPASKMLFIDFKNYKRILKLDFLKLM